MYTYIWRHVARDGAIHLLDGLVGLGNGTLMALLHELRNIVHLKIVNLFDTVVTRTVY